MTCMKPPLTRFDEEADEVFASYLREGQSREEALVSTERHFLSALGVLNEDQSPAKNPYWAAFLNLMKPFVKVSS
jgi:hypothetical protein